jgi:hypothetical protein
MVKFILFVYIQAFSYGLVFCLNNFYLAAFGFSEKY